MKISNWGEFEGKLAYPIYVDPTYSEIMELGNSGWDSIRVNDDTDGTTGLFACASGYGNTHNSVQVCVRKYVNNKFFGRTSILFKEDQDYYFNVCDFSGPEKLYWKSALHKYFSEIAAEYLEDIISHSEMQSYK